MLCEGEPELLPAADPPAPLVLGCTTRHSRLLGAGTFGRVFRAQWRGRVVAVKIIELPSVEQRLARECQHAIACTHPCVVATLAAHTVTVRTPLRRSQLMARLLRCGGRLGGACRGPPRRVVRACSCADVPGWQSCVVGSCCHAPACGAPPRAWTHGSPGAAPLTLLFRCRCCLQGGLFPCKRCAAGAAGAGGAGRGLPH